MKISELFKDSEYICKEMFWGKSWMVTIDRVESGKEVHVPNSSKKERKNVLFFAEAKRGLVLNQTNTKFLVRMFGGNDTADWKGRKVLLYTDASAMMKGKKVGGIRLAISVGKETAFSGKNPPP